MNRRPVRLAIALFSALLSVAFAVVPAHADSYVPVSGAGSTWSETILANWIKAVNQYGMRIDYSGSGSSDGRRQFLNGTVDFAASDIPFQFHPEDGSAPENAQAGTYAYMPITAGGTAFMYNLTINGQRVTNLRLSGENLTKIFTRQITTWSDPAIAADNPLLKLPNKAIVPVVRSDGSAATYHLTEWMINRYPSLWNSYCSRSGRAPACGATSLYPTVSGVIAQAGDLGIAGYVKQGYAEGSIGYVNYSYALQANFPVAKMLNAGGYYTEPTPQNVAVSLLKAQIDTNPDPAHYLTQKLEGVYGDADPRSYPLSYYGYLIIPITVQNQFNAAKGKTLAAFGYYAMCQGQQQAPSLGYSPMPINLVQASFAQLGRIPGAVVQSFDSTKCKNPTFSPDGTDTNYLAKTAPLPPACDKQGPTQCTAGTGGAKGTATAATAGSAAARTSGGGSGSGTLALGASPAATDGATAADCDPTSGSCASGGSGASSASQLAANPALIGDDSGWGAKQALMLLALLLVIAVVVLPGVLARRFRWNEES